MSKANEKIENASKSAETFAVQCVDEKINDNDDRVCNFFSRC